MFVITVCSSKAYLSAKIFYPTNPPGYSTGDIVIANALLDCLGVDRHNLKTIKFNYRDVGDLKSPGKILDTTIVLQYSTSTASEH